MARFSGTAAGMRARVEPKIVTPICSFFYLIFSRYYLAMLDTNKAKYSLQGRVV